MIGSLTAGVTVPCRGNPVRHLLAVVGAVVALGLLPGCDFLAVTDEQFVKNKMREYGEAITASMKSDNWSAPAAFHDQGVKWQQGNVTLQGRDAAQGFLLSLKAMTQMDEFFVVVKSTRRVNTELIEADVTMQAHLVLSSAELNFSNRFWEAKMGWVKRGPGNWKVAYIIETSPRQEGKFTRI